MSIRVLVRIMFVVWAMAVAALSVISHPGSKDLLMSVKLTSSGFVIHCIAYFMGIFLCYFAFEKRKDRDQMSDVRCQMSKVTFIWISGFLIFLFSMILEVVQFYLPYRTFNVYDVVGNGVGILSFVFIWVLFISHPSTIFRGYRKPTGSHLKY